MQMTGKFARRLLSVQEKRSMITCLRNCCVIAGQQKIVQKKKIKHQKLLRFYVTSCILLRVSRAPDSDLRCPRKNVPVNRDNTAETRDNDISSYIAR